MAVEQIVGQHARRQVALARRAAEEMGRLWRLVDPAHIAASWRSLLPQALVVLGSSQATAAASAGLYVDDVLEASGIASNAAGRILPNAFAGIASDGRPLASLLVQPAVTALTQIRDGASVSRSLASGAFTLDLICRTQVADAGRTAVGAAIAARAEVGGYTRMVVGKTCARCVVLAGRWYRWNAGFRRHPRCDCRHIPCQEDTAEETATNPRAYFEGLSREEQDRAFTKAGAQAIRDGADISQVVNARRGAAGIEVPAGRITAEEAQILRGGTQRGRLRPVDVFGRQLFVTTEGTTTRGQAGRRLGARETGIKQPGGRYRTARAPRLMPESIYQIAGNNREEAIRLLRRSGYIT